MEITRIEIEAGSGFGMVTEAYNEKLVLRPSSVSFVHQPASVDFDDLPIPEWNQPAKWSYKVNSDRFSKFYESIGNIIISLHESDIMALDAGSLTIRAVFANKSKKEFVSFQGCPDAEPILQKLRTVIPPLERMSEMLADYTDEEER